MGIEDLKHDDIKKEFEAMENENKEKKSIDNLKKTGDEITAKAKEISPEANENGAIDMVKAKYDIRTKAIEDKFNKGDIGEQERDKQMKEAVDEFSKDIETLVGTREGSQAKQNKDFGDKKIKEQSDYADKLTDFNKKLGDMIKLKDQQRQADARKELTGKHDKLTKIEREKDSQLIEELSGTKESK